MENKELAIIQNRILLIRNQQVMIDRDIAELYGVETKVLNQAVKRNADRFPDRFMFQLTKEEQSEIDSSSLRSQFVTLKNDTVNLRGKHSSTTSAPHSKTLAGNASPSNCLIRVSYLIFWLK